MVALTLVLDFEDLRDQPWMASQANGVLFWSGMIVVQLLFRSSWLNESVD
jgi:hypothetical protein